MAASAWPISSSLFLSGADTHFIRGAKVRRQLWGRLAAFDAVDLPNEVGDAALLQHSVEQRPISADGQQGALRAAEHRPCFFARRLWRRSWIWNRTRSARTFFAFPVFQLRQACLRYLGENALLYRPHKVSQGLFNLRPLRSRSSGLWPAGHQSDAIPTGASVQGLPAYRRGLHGA